MELNNLGVTISEMGTNKESNGHIINNADVYPVVVPDNYGFFTLLEKKET